MIPQNDSFFAQTKIPFDKLRESLLSGKRDYPLFLAFFAFFFFAILVNPAPILIPISSKYLIDSVSELGLDEIIFKRACEKIFVRKLAEIFYTIDLDIIMAQKKFK